MKIRTEKFKDIIISKPDGTYDNIYSGKYYFFEESDRVVQVCVYDDSLSVADFKTDIFGKNKIPLTFFKSIVEHLKQQGMSHFKLLNLKQGYVDFSGNELSEDAYDTMFNGNRSDKNLFIIKKILLAVLTILIVIAAWIGVNYFFPDKRDCYDNSQCAPGFWCTATAMDCAEPGTCAGQCKPR